MIWIYVKIQHKKILERTIPDALKLSIARKIENNLFSKVSPSWMQALGSIQALTVVFMLTSVVFQISFLVGLTAMGEIRTLFAAEVNLLIIWYVFMPLLCVALFAG
jgi:hypothetical protein